MASQTPDVSRVSRPSARPAALPVAGKRTGRVAPREGVAELPADMPRPLRPLMARPRLGRTKAAVVVPSLRLVVSSRRQTLPRDISLPRPPLRPGLAFPPQDRLARSVRLKVLTYRLLTFVPCPPVVKAATSRAATACPAIPTFLGPRLALQSRLRRTGLPDVGRPTPFARDAAGGSLTKQACLPLRLRLGLEAVVAPLGQMAALLPPPLLVAAVVARRPRLETRPRTAPAAAATCLATFIRISLPPPLAYKAFDLLAL